MKYDESARGYAGITGLVLVVLKAFRLLALPGSFEDAEEGPGEVQVAVLRASGEGAGCRPGCESG